MASSPGSRTAGFIASPPAVSRPCGPPFASVVSTFPAPSGKPKPHETSALMSIPGKELHRAHKSDGCRERSKRMAMLDEAHYWAETQFGAAELGDIRRTGRLVSTMAAIARAPDESLPRQLGSLAGAKAAYRLFDCGAVTREAVMDPHLAQCRAEAARHPIVLMVHDDTTLDFSTHRRLQDAGRVGDDHGTGFLAHSCLAVLPSGETLGLAHQTIWARPPKGVTRPTRESAVWAQTVATIGRPPAGSRFVSVGDRGADVFEHLESVRDTGWDAVVRAAQDRRLVTGGGSLTALHTARAMGAATVLTPAGRGGRLCGLARVGASAAAQRSRGTCVDPGVGRARLERHLGMAAADHAASREPRPGARDHRLVLPALDCGRISQGLEDRLPGRTAAAGGGGSAGPA